MMGCICRSCFVFSWWVFWKASCLDFCCNCWWFWSEKEHKQETKLKEKINRMIFQTPFPVSTQHSRGENCRVRIVWNYENEIPTKRNVLEWMDINRISLAENPSPQNHKTSLWIIKPEIKKKHHPSNPTWSWPHSSLLFQHPPPKVREAIPSNKGNSARSNSSGRAFCCGCPAVKSRPSRPWSWR